MNIKQEIKDLQARVALLEQQIIDDEQYDWDNAPVITTIDGIEYRLGSESPEELSWYDAVDWCKSVGGELPDRQVLLACYVNEAIRSHFAAGFYWSSTENFATNAWTQYFFNGFQSNGSKINSNYVRAVRGIAI